jgi:hypothetical protein
VAWAPNASDIPNLGPSLFEQQYAARVSAAFIVGAAAQFSIKTTIRYGDGTSQSFISEGQFINNLSNLLSMVQTGLDVVGLIPGIGEFADGANGIIYVLQGDWTNAGLSLASMLPVGGQAASAARIGKRFSPDQSALLQLVQDAVKRKGGLTSEQVTIIRGWANEVKIPFRGPESHPGRTYGQFPHIHVGPIDHVQVIP